MIRKVQSALGERSFPAELLFARRLQGRACLGFRETTNLPVSRLSDQLRTLLKEEAGLTLEPPRQEEGVLIYEETPRWHVDAGWAARALAEDADNTGNGDAILMTRLPDGRFLGMLSDGMGHGREAHEESTRALEPVPASGLHGGTDADSGERYDACGHAGGGIRHGGLAAG